MNIYDRIKELTASKNISVAELERNLNFSNGSISKWVRISPSAEKVTKVAKYLDVSADYLLGTEINNDPLNYYRMDTAGLSNDEIREMQEELEDYNDYLKEKLRRKRESR